MQRRPYIWAPQSMSFLIGFCLLLGNPCAVDAQKICQDLPPDKPRTTANFSYTSCEQRIQWFDCALRHYAISREDIRLTAQTNNIPTRLLATVIANELMDYGKVDILQESVFTGAGSSAGIAQLQPNRLVKHRLIEPPIISLPDLGMDSPPVVDYDTIWKQLIKPIAALEYAAREINWILNALTVAHRDGYEFPFFYLERGGVISADNPYRDVKPLTLYPQLTPGHDDSSVRVRKEGALAHAVGIAYNNGALSQGEHVIWNWNSRTQGDPLLSSAKGGVSHGANARGYWARCFAEQGWPNERKAEVNAGCYWVARNSPGRFCHCNETHKTPDGYYLKKEVRYRGEEARRHCGNN